MKWNEMVYKNIEMWNMFCWRIVKMYEVEMLEEFYPKLHLKESGQGPGDKFNGPSIKTILNDEWLKIF